MIETPVEAPKRYITNSELQTFKTCKRQWYMGYHLRLAKRRADGSEKAATTGTLVHNVLEVYYKDPERDASSALQSLHTARAADPAADNYSDEYNLAAIMVEGYFSWLEETGADQGLKIKAVEQKISCPAPAPFDEFGVWLLGKLDLIAERDGMLLTIDHKDQPLTAKVLTPFGWKTMGEMLVGDIVTNPSGGWSLVTGVFPQGTQPVYRITFKDGSTTEAGADHLWEVRSYWEDEWSVRTTTQLAATLTSGSRYRYRMPVPVVEFPERHDLLLPAYTLGVWLGDGSNHGTTVTAGLEDQAELVEHLQLAGTTVATGYADPLKIHLCRSRRLLSALDLIGSRCKAIPQQYLESPVSVRMELLRGLMDTDGHCDKTSGRTKLVTTSPGIRDGVTDLVRSLGGTCFWHEFVNDSGNLTWMLSIRIPDHLGAPFKLKRKVEVYDSFQRRELSRVPVSIERVDDAETQCISVSPGSLYITDDYIVTHNTVQNFSDSVALLPMNEQSRMYNVIQRRLHPEAPLHGAIWNMLRKVKRSSRSKPPFYLRDEVVWSEDQLRVFWHRLRGEIAAVLQLEQQLSDGADHHEVAYPSPSKDCTWRCEFYPVCPLMDDPRTDSAMLIDAMYQTYNPLERYASAE